MKKFLKEVSCELNPNEENDSHRNRNELEPERNLSLGKSRETLRFNESSAQ